MVSGGATPLGPWEEVRPLARDGFVGDLYAGIAGVRVEDHRPVFPVTRGEEEAAARMLGRGDRVAFAPGGGSNPRDTVPWKRWNVAGYAEVARWCLGRGLGVCLLGDSRDMAASAEVARLCPGVLDLAGRTTLGEAAAVLGSCRAFLGADSGLAHLARSAGTTAVVLFGPTDHSRLYPPGGVVPVVSGAPCSPCYSNEVFPGCRSGLDCMGRIDPGLVRDRLERALDARRDD
jgi:heptosyltransferase-2